MPDAIQKISHLFKYNIDSLLPLDSTSSKTRKELREKINVEHTCGRRINIFLACLCKPLHVGTFVGNLLSYTYAGDSFPQFTADIVVSKNGQYQRCSFNCEICIPYQNYCYSHRIDKHAKPRGFKNTDLNLKPFIGLQQLESHQKSTAHLEAITFFTLNVPVSNSIKSNMTPRSTLSQPRISDVFYTPSQHPKN